MRLILADNNLSAALPAGLLAALAKAGDLQALFLPGGAFASLGSLIDQLTGADAAERARYDALLIQVRNDLATNYARQTGANLWAPFTSERAAWLLDVLAIEMQRASADLQAATDPGVKRVAARYMKAFRTILDETMQRLKEQQKTLDPSTDKSLENTGLLIGGAGLALKLLGVI